MPVTTPTQTKTDPPSQFPTDLDALSRDPERVYAVMCPALREKAKEVREWLEAETHHSLLSRYRLGLILRDVEEDEQSHGGERYGEDAVNRLRALLPWEDGIIRIALRFVRAYSQEEAERLAQLRTRNGQPLAWSHVRCLVQVDDRQEREELLDRTVAENWTSLRLAEEVKAYHEEKNPSNRGRPLTRPKTFDAVLHQQQGLADRFIERSEQVWADGDHSLTRRFTELTPDERTEERVEELEAHVERLRRLRDAVEKRLREAEAVLTKFRKAVASAGGSGVVKKGKRSEARTKPGRDRHRPEKAGAGVGDEDEVAEEAEVVAA
jgi:hypothetical protein